MDAVNLDGDQKQTHDFCWPQLICVSPAVLEDGRNLGFATDDAENADAGECAQDTRTHHVADHSARVVDDVAHQSRQHYLG